MAVSGMTPGDTAVKVTRSSIIPESATLAYTPTELAQIAARKTQVSQYSGNAVTTFNPYGYYSDPFSGPGGGVGGFPTGGAGTQITGAPCVILQAFGYPCTTQGAVQAIGAGVNLFTGGGDSPGASASCPDGYQVNPQTGICEKTGVGGAVQRFIPGGQTGTMADAYGEAVVGAFGIPALVPAQVGTIQRRDGTTGAVLRCPPGAVLGRDSLCYQKGSISKQFRKWRPPSGRCPISKKDWAAIKAIGRVQKTIKKVASEAGMSAKKR